MSAAPKRSDEREAWLQRRVAEAMAVQPAREAFEALGEQMMALALSVADGNNRQVVTDRDACSACITALEKELGKMPAYSGEYAVDLPTILGALVQKSIEDAVPSVEEASRGKVNDALGKAFGGRKIT
jgi:hypothetical protein